MRTFQSIRKRLKGISQRQNLFSNFTVNTIQNQTSQFVNSDRLVI